MRVGKWAVPAGLLVVAIGGVALAIVGARGGDDDDDGGAAGSATSTTMATGGMDIAAPDGWTDVPLPTLGFGIAVPPGWEATRLDAQGLASTSEASPAVPGFVDAAHAAAQSGALLYAAGVDAEGRVTDLKVLAEALDSGITDAAGLQTYALQLVSSASLSPTVEVVPDTAQPTVEARFQATAQRPVEGADDGSTEEVTAEVTERLVLSPRGVIYTMIVTSEDPATHDDVANQVFSTLTFPANPQ